MGIDGKFQNDVAAIKARGLSAGDGSYVAGFNQMQEYALNIAFNADSLIEELFDALERRHADDFVDEIKEKYGYVSY